MIDSDEAAIRPEEAAKLVGRRTRTLARWADTGQIGALLTLGGHRRYRATEVQAMLATRPAGRNAGADSRRGRALTTEEISALAAAGSVAEWTELAIAYQADGSSIRQIAAGTGISPATVSARILRAARRKRAG